MRIQKLSRHRPPGAIVCSGNFPACPRLNTFVTPAIGSKQTKSRPLGAYTTATGYFAPIRTAINQHLKNQKIAKVQRNVSAYYQLVENYEGSRMVIQIEPNGNVRSVNTEEPKAKDQAVTATHKIAPGH